MIYQMKTSILAILGHFWPVFGLLWRRYQFPKLSMSIIDLVLTALSEIGEKSWITMIYMMKMPILAILGHFWPVFGLLKPQYQFPKFSMSISDLVLTALSEIGEKILNNNDIWDENADFDHLRPFLACFWPIVAPVLVFKALNEYIWSSSDWIGWDKWKNSE